MAAFISWYIVITILGWLTFPLAYHLFPALADRGYALARAFGLLVWGYVFWLFASLFLIILLSALGYLGFSLWGGWREVMAALALVQVSARPGRT